MDLLNRYLQAVGEHLPARGKADTLAELRANLLAQIDAREEELDRPLTEAEVATVLEQHGRPMLVAARYLPQHYLIGPGIFPIYWITLRKSFPFLLLAYLATQAVALIFQGFGGFDVGAVIGHLPSVVLSFWAVMTLAFAAFEYGQGRYFAEVKVPKGWNPNDLPPIATSEKKNSMAGAVADLIVSVLFVAWLLTVPSRPYLLIGPAFGYVRGLPYGLTPEWHIFYWQIMILLIATLPLKMAILFTPLRGWRNALQLTVQALGILILVVMVQARSYFVPAAALTSENLHTLAGINTAINAGFKIALTVSVLKLLWDLWKMVSGSHVEKQGCATAK